MAILTASARKVNFMDPIPIYQKEEKKRKGKAHLTYIRKRDLEKIEKKTEEYSLFQKRFEYIRHLNRRIDDLFKRIREMRIEESERIKVKENRKK